MNEEEAIVKSQFLKEADILDWTEQARFIIFHDTLTILREPQNFIIHPLYYFNNVEFVEDEPQGEVKLNKEDLKEFVAYTYPSKSQFESCIDRVLALKRGYSAG